MSTTGNPFGMSNTRAQAAAQLPNFAELFNADPTYKNFMGLNQQFTQIANAFGQGNSPFSLQDIQEGASAFQQAVNPYAQQFSEQSNREALALRMAEQQQLAAQGQGAPMQQAAFAQPAYSPAFPSSFPQQSPYSNFYGSPQLQNAVNKQYGGGNQNVIPLEGRFGLVRLAGGGEVSEARRMLQNLQNANEVQAGQMINRFAGGGYAAGRFNRAMVEPDAITGRGDRNLFELFDRNDRAMIAPVGPNEDGGFGPPAYTAPAPAPPAYTAPAPAPVAEPQLQKDGFLPLLRPVLPPAPVEQVQRLIQEGRVPSNYVTGPYDAQGLSDEDMTRWIASTYEPGGANAPGALPYIFAPDYVDPLQKAYEQAQENAARAYQEVLDKRAAEQAPSPPPVAEPLPPPVAEPLPPPVAEPLPPPVAEPLPPPVAEPTPEPPPVAEPPGGIVTLPERPPVAELPRISPPEPPPAIPEPPPPITLPEIKERPVEPIKVPKVDEEFRSSPVRSFDPVTGSFRYTLPTKLDSATGAGTTWTPPTITSRKRQLLNVDYLPGIDVPQYDPLTNQLYQPALSASQRFAGDRNMQMAALQQLKTASPMSSATYLALQSRLRAGEFGGIGGQPVDMERLKAAATAMVPPVPGLKIGSLSDTAGGSQGSNVPAGFGSGVPVTLGVPTIGRKDGGEVSTEDFIKKQSGGDVSRETASPETRKTRLPSGVQRAVSKAQESRTVVPVPGIGEARQFMSGFIGAQPDYSVMDPNYKALGSAYRTGEQTSVAADVFGALTPFATASALSKASQIPGLAELIAYHGSPHKFKKFDASKIGTGEGAQAYGHGLYFAESPNVANTYASMRSPMPRLYKNGKPFEAKTHAEMLAEARALGAGSIDEAIERQTSKLQGSKKNEQGVVLLEETGRSIEEERRILDALRTIKAEGYQPGAGGYLYTVDIPDEKIAQMLDWDKPLSQQPKAVQEFAKSKDPNLASKEPHFLAPSGEIFHWTELLENVDQLKDKKMREMSPKIFGGGEWVDYGDYLLSKTTGGDFYRSLSAPSEWSKQASIGAGRTGFDDVETSALLREAGIPGIQYLDQASRDAKQGTRNFVVFPGEEQNIKMLDINGELLEKQDGGEVTTEEFIKKNVPRGTSTSKQQLDKLAQISQRKKA